MNFIIDASGLRAYAPNAESAAAIVRALRVAGYQVTVRAWSETSRAYFTADF